MNANGKLNELKNLMALAAVAAAVALAPNPVRASEEPGSIRASDISLEEEAQVMRRIAVALSQVEVRQAQVKEENTPETCTSDMDRDGIVDGYDLGMLLGSFGACAELAEDINQDGVVGHHDLILVLANWGECEPETEPPSGLRSDPDTEESRYTLYFEICAGDINGDGVVDAFDLARIYANYNREYECSGDLNGDGEVNTVDLGMLQRDWGACE